MKTHTTNYQNTLILPAEDCPVATSQLPPLKKEPTIANRQLDMMAGAPYAHDSDDVLFTVFADKAGISQNDRKEARVDFFSKGQACLRASPLTKRYGWAIHADEQGKVALVDTASREFERLFGDEAVKKVRAMRSSRS